MLSWSKAPKRLDMLAGQLGTMGEEIASLRAALAEETERAVAAEERLRDRAAALDSFGEQLQQLRDELYALGGSVSERLERLEQRDSSERVERLEQRESERETERGKIALTLTKLEKRIDQQAEDAATAAALLLERIEAVRQSRSALP